MRSVVVCGSKRYNKEIAKFCKQSEKLGVLVFEPSIGEPIFENEKFQSDYVTGKIFKGLTLEHFDWVRKADICYLYNADDYIGTSVKLELGYAVALGKPIFALSPKTGDPCSDVLIDKVIKTPAALVTLL
jgi:nucleoside 2-deoxyribosyltransferase